MRIFLSSFLIIFLFRLLNYFFCDTRVKDFWHGYISKKSFLFKIKTGKMVHKLRGTR